MLNMFGRINSLCSDPLNPTTTTMHAVVVVECALVVGGVVTDYEKGIQSRTCCSPNDYHVIEFAELAHLWLTTPTTACSCIKLDYYA